MKIPVKDSNTIKVKFTDYTKVKECFSLVQEKKVNFLCYAVDGNESYYYFENK